MNEPMLMLDNMKLWKDVLDKEEEKVCDGMTESECKAYKLGVQNLYDLFWQMLEQNHEQGCYTVLYPDENIKPEEFALDDFYDWHDREMENNNQWACMTQ